MVRIQKINLLFVLLLVTTFVHAQFQVSYGDYSITYQYADDDNTGLEVYSCDPSDYAGAIVIPNTENITDDGVQKSLPVVSICKDVFKNHLLTSINIPANVTFIGKNAFENCTMKKVFFPSFNDIMKITFENNGNPMARAEETWAGEEKIGPELTIAQDVNDNAFNGVKWLTKVTFKFGVTSIGECAFCNCINLESIGFSEEIENITIGTSAFQNCNKLLKIGENNDIPTIPSCVTTVGKEAFKECKSLSEVVIEAHLETLPDGMFRTCESLKKVTLWNGTTKIGKSAFNGCTSLTSFPFQDIHIKIISESAFLGCGFNTLTLPTSLADDPSLSEKAIGLNAFKNCNNLTDLTIPKGVSNFSIDNYAFTSENNSLKFIYSDADIVPSATPLSFTGNTPQLFCNESTLDAYQSATPWMDFNPTKIEKYSITYVKNNDMKNPVDGVTNVQAGTTLHLNSLQAEEGWTTPHGWFIKNEQGEFENAPEVMPASDLILYCYYTTTYADGDIKYSLRSDTKEATILADESNKSLTGSLTIPSAVTYKSNDYEIIAIEDEAFKDAVNLTGVDLSGATNLTSIGKGIFEGCKNLASVTLPNTLTEISDNMFYNCAALTGLTIPASVTKIGEKAFSKSGILEITLPANITDMGNSVFQECKSMKKVTFASGTPLVTLPDFTFESCINLKSFTLPATITTIGQKAFSYCQGLTEIKLDNIKIIKSSAFKNCEFLKVITLPTVFNIGDDAFNFCLSVEKITINSNQAPIVGNNPFYVKDGKINAVLYVKDVSKYQSAPWKLFKKVYPIDPIVIPSDQIEITLSQTIYTYNGDAKIPGVTVKWKNGDQVTPISEEEYIKSYTNNTNAGTTATVTITDKDGGFYKIADAYTTFTINKADVVLNDLLKTPPTIKEKLTYNDKDIQLIKAGTLKNSKTGTLEYSTDGKNFAGDIPTKVDAGTYQVYYRVKGDENHNDSEIVEMDKVTIAPKTLSSKEIEITLSQDTYTYTGEEKEPVVTVKYGETVFIKDKDFTVSYKNNINAGTTDAQPTVVITDIDGGNFVVSGSKKFTINKADISLDSFDVPPTGKENLVFNGTAEAFAGTAQALINAGTLKEPLPGTLEYSLDGRTYAEEIPTGTDVKKDYKVYYRVKGDNNHNTFAISDPLVVPIAPKELTSEDLDITLTPASYTYDGSEKKPDVTVKFGNTEFTRDKDYTVGYSNNKNVGTEEAQPTVTINDKDGGNYIVSGSKTFEIARAASSLTKDPTVKTLTYSGADQTLINAGTSNTGKVQYRLGEEGEFSETIPAGKDAGTYQVYYRVKGDANHSNSEISDPLVVTIAPKELTSREIVITLNQETYSYTGTEIKPVVTVKYGETVFKEGDDYTVSYENNKNAGTTEAQPTVVITDIDGGNFIVSGRKPFTINKADVVLKDLLETAPAAIALTFNGTAKAFNGTAQPLIKAGVLKDPQTGTLEYCLDGKTFSEEIPTGTDANTYKVYYRVKGDGNHNDSKNSDPLEVVIAPKELTSEELEITLAPSSYTYDGSEKKPDVTVKFGDTEFTKDKDYTVSYSNCKNVGIEEAQPTVTIKDKNGGNYIVSGSKTFTILPAASSLTNTPTARNNTYDGTDLALLNTDGKSNTGKLQYRLGEEGEFSETIPTGKDAGNYTVYYRVKGDANHSDSEPVPVSATIAPREANALSLSQSSYTYDGGEIKPSVTVQWNNTTVPGSEYTVSYSNNINAGIATVIVTDKEGGNFSVNDSKTFTINKADVVLKDILETPPTAIALTFNGTAKAFNGAAQALINAGTLKEPLPGTLEYSLDGKTFSEEIPTGTDANTYKVYYRVKGDGNHNDSKNSDPLEVVIAPKELTSEELEITLAPSSYTYDGSEKKPDVTVKFGDTEFTKDKDYTISYSNCKNVGTEEAQPTVTIKDKDGGNYIVSGSKTFTILPAASSLTNTPTARNNTYDGTDLALLNTDGKSDTGKLQYSLSKDEKSFSETIPTGKNAGDYTVYYRVKGDANHSDSEIGSVKATIAPREANALSLSQSSYTYDGGEKIPSVTVQWNNTTVPGSEYTVSYSNNINAGIATVIVTDKEGGNFTVSGSKTFTIAKVPLTISADSYEIFEGEKLPEFTIKYDGFVNNETEAVLTAKPIVSCNATATSKPGDYTISVGGSKAANYDITHKSGKLTIIAMKFVSGGESSKDEDDAATYQITSTGKDVGTTPTVAIVDDKEVGGAFAIPEAVTYHNTNYKVTEINESAFENNKYLTEVSIPSSITSIGDKAFKGCSNLKSITVYVTTPISLAVAGTRGEETNSGGASVFDGVDKTTCILYVPEASVDLYKAAPVWKDFQHILPISGTTGISVVNVTEGEPFDVYNLQGGKVKARATDLRGLPRGIYIINGKKVAVK